MEHGTPSVTNGNGVTRIGTSGLLRPHSPHGLARGNGRHKAGTDMAMMDGHGGTGLLSSSWT